MSSFTYLFLAAVGLMIYSKYYLLNLSILPNSLYIDIALLMVKKYIKTLKFSYYCEIQLLK